MATIMNKSLMIMIVVSLCLVFHGQLTKADLQRIKHPTKEDGSLTLLVVGDWGRKGHYNQTLVAQQMGIVGKQLDVDFIVSTGDNFYDDGLRGVNDPAFAESFTNIYTAPSLQKIWYNVLGNHDYRGDVLAQLSSDLREKDSKWFCNRSYIVNAGEIADLFFVDTTPFKDSYFEDWEHAYDWRGILPRQDYLSNLLEDLNQALKESSAKWKFVIGHHTLMSAGSHGNTVELVEKLLPILKENDVDLYINGHDHCLQHISSPDSSPLQFLTSGGGSMAWRGDINPWNPDELKLYYDGQGFMSMQVTSTQVDVVFYDISGNVLHKWSRTKKDLYASL